MFIWTVFLITFYTNTMSSAQSDDRYNEEDLIVIKGFTQSLQINSLVFVTNEKSLGAINFLKLNVYSVVISSTKLNEILEEKSARDDFFATGTMVVSKETLNFTSIFERLSERHSPTWVVFINSHQQLQHFYIPLSTDFYTVQYTHRTIVINKAYHIRPDWNITLIPNGIWQRQGNNTVTILKSRTNDFEGVTLDMLHFLSEECKISQPILMLNRIECFHQEILRILAGKLNYRIRKVECPERVHPYNYPNGTLSDLFVILSRKEVDFSSASYVVNNDRLDNYDFAWPIFTSKSMLYIKNKKQSVWRGYLRPMHKYLWRAIGFWILGVGLLIQFFQECRGRRFKPRLSLLPDLVKSVFTSLQVFCSQGLHDIPRWYSSRILFLMSFSLFVILYQVYSGFLISFLMIDVPNIPFTDINGFFRNGRYKIITLDRGFHNYYTNKIIDDLKMDPSKFKLPPEQLPTRIEEGIRKLCHIKRLTYIEFRENIVMHEIPCKIIELPTPMFYQSIGIGFPKNSPYRESINREVISLNSVGILQRMRKRLFSYVKLKEKETSNEEYVKVSLKHVVSIFFILTMGMTIAWELFVLEHLFVLLMKLYRKVRNRKTVAKADLKALFIKRALLFNFICLKWPKFSFGKK